LNNTLHHKNTGIRYEIRYTKRKKTIGIKICGEKQVTVYSPRGFGKKYIESLLIRKWDWIINKSRPVETINGCMVGDPVLFLGKEYKISINNTRNIRGSKNISAPYLDQGSICVPSDSTKIRNTLIAFYKREAGKTIKKRVRHYAAAMGVAPRKVMIKDNRASWGTCTSKKTLNFTYRLIMAPIEIVDYVVVHELSHLVHMGHSKDFWKTVGQHISDVKQKRKWLRENGHALHL
jgi:predicted metal-dependent hydrolase